MPNFPIEFQDQTVVLGTEFFGPEESENVMRLQSQALELHAGLTTELAEEISQVCLEDSIREYCPNDAGERFANLQSTAKWISKGRSVFLLLKNEDNGPQIYGYGWVGPGKSDHVPGGETTFALRISEAGQGQGLATPFSRLILVAAAQMNGAANIWLDAWKSNGAAVHIYHKLGFVDVANEMKQRPTADGGQVEDVRLYMSLPNSLLSGLKENA